MIQSYLFYSIALDLFEIEIHFEEITTTLKDAEIAVEGLFLNADAGFDSKELRNKYDLKGIIPNFDINKRNSSNDNDYYFDEENCTKSVIVLRELMLGWIAIEVY